MIVGTVVSVAIGPSNCNSWLRSEFLITIMYTYRKINIRVYLEYFICMVVYNHSRMVSFVCAGMARAILFVMEGTES